MILPFRLDCTGCGTFQRYEHERDNLVRCAECGKRHSYASVYAVRPGKEYERSRDGTLVETPP